MVNCECAFFTIPCTCCMAGKMGHNQLPGATDVVRDAERGTTAPPLAPQQHLGPGKLQDLPARDVSRLWVGGGQRKSASLAAAATNQHTTVTPGPQAKRRRAGRQQSEQQTAARAHATPTHALISPLDAGSLLTLPTRRHEAECKCKPQGEAFDGDHPFVILPCASCASLQGPAIRRRARTVPQSLRIS